MFYFSKETIKNSFAAICNNVDNKFFGLLGILRCIETNYIIPNHTYTFIDGDLSQWLDDEFYMSDFDGEYANNKMFAKFSMQWVNFVASTFIHTSISIFSVIVFLYKRESFTTQPSYQELVSRFCNDYHIDITTIEKWFSTRKIDIEYTEEHYSKQQIGILLGSGAKTISMVSPYSVSSRAGELSRAPFVQTLYAGLDCIKCLLLLRENIADYYVDIESIPLIPKKHLSSLPLQQIYFGAPGTGKSHAIKVKTEAYKDTTIRTTFHPDSDYASFVGCYKPSMRSVKQTYINEGEQKPVLNAQKEQVSKDEIVYAYTPQAFLQAYTLAWQRQQDNTPVFLIIEEINRGNCAQIFGDLFQLLDRDANGYSEYAIRADRDMQDYLRRTLGDYAALPATIASGEELQLPPNLHIWATMNTSDQSLFPIDSAFKRRWQWKYCPITDMPNLNYKIDVDGEAYPWWEVIERINQEIENVTKSEDKKLGYFFVTPEQGDTISADTFVNKVVFYLWNDVFKDAYANTLFADGLTFYRFFEANGDTNSTVLKQFLERILKKGDNA